MDFLMTYPNHSVLSYSYTDAYQRGTMIIQKWLVAYRSLNWVEIQHNYHTMEKELLSIVMVLEDSWCQTSQKYCSYFLCPLLAYICISVWPTILYHPGTTSLVANTFSIMCCRFQKGRMHQLTSLNLLPKASTLVMNLIYLSDSLTCFLPDITANNLLTSNGYIPDKIWVLSLPWPIFQ